MAAEIKITDLLDVIHLTIIKQKGVNDVILDELKTIEQKLESGALQNYDVSETTFWKTIVHMIKKEK